MDSTQVLRAFALANAFKEGDLAVGGTRDDLLRAEAKRELLAMRVADIRLSVFVDDGVSAALERGRDRGRDGGLDSLTMARIKETLLGESGPEWARTHRDAMPSEVIAAIAKVMTDVVRDDEDGEVSYLLHCERSSGQYLFGALFDAGEEFGIEVGGFVDPGK